jgi:hypothetical protein
MRLKDGYTVNARRRLASPFITQPRFKERRIEDIQPYHPSHGGHTRVRSIAKKLYLLDDYEWHSSN